MSPTDSGDQTDVGQLHSGARRNPGLRCRNHRLQGVSGTRSQAPRPRGSELLSSITEQLCGGLCILELKGPLGVDGPSHQ